MRVDPVTQLNEAIMSVFEAIVYPSMVVMAAMLVVVGAIELRSRMRGPDRRQRTAGDRRAGRGDVAPAAR